MCCRAKFKHFLLDRNVADATFKPNGIKTLLTNGFSAFFIKVKLVFGNGPRNLQS